VSRSKHGGNSGEGEITEESMEQTTSGYVDERSTIKGEDTRFCISSLNMYV